MTHAMIINQGNLYLKVCVEVKKSVFFEKLRCPLLIRE